MLTKIIIADDHPMFRYGIKAMLNEEADMRVVGEANNGLEVLQLSQELKPDLVLLDVIMPKMDGIQAIQLLSRQFPMMKFLVMSSFSYAEIQNETLRAGAANFISKNSLPEELVHAIRATMSNAKIPTYSGDYRLCEKRPLLTASEYKALILLSEGLDRGQIAERLGVSYDTVKTHLRHLYKKLDVSTSFEAVRVALRNGIIG